MKIVTISDVHIKESNDLSDKLLMKFFRHPDVQSAQVIIFLGDIFDLMIGPMSQYFTRFPHFFSELENAIASGKTIYFVEGNHDFHLKLLFRQFFKIKNQLNAEKFNLMNEVILTDQVKIYFSHGDDVEIENLPYKLFKRFVTSAPVTFFANYLMPHFFIKNIGESSARASRKRNNKRYSSVSDLAPIKEKFRKSYEVFHKKMKERDLGMDLYVGGHSHVKDYYKSSAGFAYINNGYAPHSQSFILIENGEASFIQLDSSP